MVEQRRNRFTGGKIKRISWRRQIRLKFVGWGKSVAHLNYNFNLKIYSINKDFIV